MCAMRLRHAIGQTGRIALIVYSRTFQSFMLPWCFRSALRVPQKNPELIVFGHSRPIRQDIYHIFRIK